MSEHLNVLGEMRIKAVAAKEYQDAYVGPSTSGKRFDGTLYITPSDEIAALAYAIKVLTAAQELMPGLQALYDGQGYNAHTMYAIRDFVSLVKEGM